MQDFGRVYTVRNKVIFPSIQSVGKIVKTLKRKLFENTINDPNF